MDDFFLSKYSASSFFYFIVRFSFHMALEVHVLFNNFHVFLFNFSVIVFRKPPGFYGHIKKLQKEMPGMK